MSSAVPPECGYIPLAHLCLPEEAHRYNWCCRGNPSRNSRAKEDVSREERSHAVVHVQRRPRIEMVWPCATMLWDGEVEVWT